MTTIQKYSYEGPVSGLKLAMIPLNGLPCRVYIDGTEFDVKALNGHSPAKRTFMAREVANAHNDFIWHWHVGTMVSLRNQLQYIARLRKEARARKVELLARLDINLTDPGPIV